MLEYAIIKGVRHYRMSPKEPWKVDNVSSAEAERRLATQVPVPRNASQVKATPKKKTYGYKKKGIFGLFGGR